MKHKDKDPVSAYLHEIGRYPLLTPEQEIQHGRQVQRKVALEEVKNALSAKLGREPTLTEWAHSAGLEETKLHKAIAAGQIAKRNMIESNLRLVVSVAKKYQNCDMEFLDLIQEGNIGLNRAVEKFKPELGYKFSTYAYWWICQGISRAIAQQSRTIRWPVRVTEQLNKIKKAHRKLSQEKGCTPTLEELSLELEVTVDQLQEFFRHLPRFVSLETKIGKDKETTLEDFIPSLEEEPIEYCIWEEEKEELSRLLKHLNPRDAKILSLRYGLDGEPRSYKEIADLLGLAAPTVKKAVTKSLNKLSSVRAKNRIK